MSALQPAAAALTASLGRDASGFSLFGHPSRQFNCAWRPGDSSTLASVGEDGCLRLWDCGAARAQRLSLRAWRDEALRCAWSPGGGQLVAAAGADGKVMVWHCAAWDAEGAAEGTEEDRVRRHRTQLSAGSEEVYALQFDGGGTGLMAACGSAVGVYDVATGQLRAGHEYEKSSAGVSVGGQKNPEDAAFVFDAALGGGAGGELLAVAMSDGSVRLQDLRERGESLGAIQTTEPLTSVVWAPDGTTLAGCGGQGGLFVWDVRVTAALRATGHSASGRTVFGACFAQPDGLLLSWDAAGSVVCWDSGGSGDLAPLSSWAGGERAPLYCCAYDAESQRLALAGSGEAGQMGLPLLVRDAACVVNKALLTQTSLVDDALEDAGAAGVDEPASSL